MTLLIERYPKSMMDFVLSRHRLQALFTVAINLAIHLDSVPVGCMILRPKPSRLPILTRGKRDTYF